MSFPYADYGDVLTEAAAIVRDRDAKGRNAATPFYDGHNSRDISFELKRRASRIIGSELVGGTTTVRRDDALDLLNYAAFYVMLLDREASASVTKTTPTTPPTPPLQST